ncbi:MAG: hypothetical protein AAF456_12385 [Planctomycetota bacterium]
MKKVALITTAIWLIACQTESFAQPQYEIISLGQAGESFSGGQAAASGGMFVAGFSDNDPFVWDATTGVVTPLPSEATRPFSTPWAVNDSGAIVGIGATTFFGSSALPVIWDGGTASALQLPSGQTLGRAYGINNSELIVGSVNGGSLEQAAVFSTSGPGTVLTQTFNGGDLITAYGVNDSGRIVGQGSDPNNAAVTKGWFLDDGDSAATDIGALTSRGHNSAIPFDVCSAGFITGSSSLNSGADGRPFFWSDAGGMIEIPLPSGTSTASGRGVNDHGWVVGTGGGATAVPFLWDGNNTYRLQTLITEGGAGWDLEAGTSNGAFSISDDGTVTGRGLLDGELTAFAMVLLEPEPVAPDSVTTTKGLYAGGDVSSIGSSDNIDYRIQRSSFDLQSRTELEVKATSPSSNPSSFDVTLEGSVFARSNVEQTIELYDYDLQAWELVDTRDAARSPSPDSVVTLSASGDLSRFVEPGTRCIEARIRYQSATQRQQFQSNTDQFEWRIR